MLPHWASNENLKIPFTFHTIGKPIEAETLTYTCVWCIGRVMIWLKYNPSQVSHSCTCDANELWPLHWWKYLHVCLLELKCDGGAGAQHYLWLLMTIVEEDTDWGKSCQRASPASSWRSHVAHMCSIHPGWNTQRREMYPECCRMVCVHGMCVHGTFFMWDVWVQPSLIFGQMEVCLGFWLTRLLNMCDPNVCCVVCRINNKRKEGIWKPKLIRMFLSSCTCSVPSQWNMWAFTWRCHHLLVNKRLRGGSYFFLFQIGKLQMCESCQTLHFQLGTFPRKVTCDKRCSHIDKYSFFQAEGGALHPPLVS